MVFGLSKKEREAKARAESAKKRKDLKTAVDAWNKLTPAQKKANQRWKPQGK